MTGFTDDSFTDESFADTLGEDEDEDDDDSHDRLAKLVNESVLDLVRCADPELALLEASS
jgi:hypothetical protein